MSFLADLPVQTSALRAGRDDALLHRMGCRACPLAHETANLHPYMDATGAKKPLVYMLGEGPDRVEDEQGRQFVGESGGLLRPLIPERYRKLVRWNNSVNCFPGDTLVSDLGGVQKAFKRWYDGDTVTAWTKGGRQLTGTPNHPVLTRRGWVPMGLLRQGDDLICDKSWKDRVLTVDPDVDHPPSPIEQRYKALLKAGNVRRMVRGSVNFHGDVPDGDVYVIAAKSGLSLEERSQLGVFQRCIYAVLDPNNLTKGPLARLCRVLYDLASVSVRKAIYSGVVFESLSSFLNIMRGVPHAPAFGGSSNFYAAISEVANDSACLGPEMLCKFFGATPAFVECDGVSTSRRLPASVSTSTDDLLFLESSKLDTLLGENALYSVTSKLEPIPDLRERHSISVEADEVARICRGKFSGHVYTLQTGQGVYIAEGVIVSNCRPPKNRTPVRVEVECCRSRVTADIEAARPRAIFGFGNVPLEWAIGQQGITMWRGRRLPVRVGQHTCWYYPMLHPSYLLHSRKKGRPSDEELLFEIDLARAFDEVGDLPPAVVHTATDARAGTSITTDGGRDGLRQIRELLEWAAAQPLVGWDYETSCLRPYAEDARILTVAVGTPDRAVSFPFDHPDAPWADNELTELADVVRDFLRAPRVRRAVHNLAFELEWTGVIFGEEYVRAGLWEDTASQAAVLDERHRKMKEGPFSLNWLTQQYFGFPLKSLFPALDKANLADTPLETVLYYNAPDAKYHAALCLAQEERIRAEGLKEAYRLALRRVPTVVLSQMRGAPVNQAEVKRLKKKYDARIAATEKKIAALPIARKFEEQRGTPFNPRSDKDVHHVFVDMLHREECAVVDKYTKETKYSADEGVLSRVDHPLAPLILDLRRDNKRRSTYVEPLQTGSPLLYPDGCIHYQLNTIFARTGRLSADSPNIQNFPKRDDEGVEVRRPIVAPPGHVILAFDYGQIEARVIAMFTRDKRFCQALWDRYDIHMDWAERIAYAYPRRVGGKKMLKDKKAMKDFRTDIKNQWTFPLVFLARLSSVAGYLSIPEDVLEPLFEDFWEEFSGIRTWQEEVVKFYKEHGYVECLTGRRRRGPLTINMIANSPVQGTAAEIVMDGMARLSETGDPELQPEFNIHDDLTFLRVPEKRVDDVAEKVITHMLDTPFEWARTVPLTIEMSCGRNWMPYDAKINPEGLRAEDDWTFSSDEWFR
jgi:DNA polymerase I-like protein with 3'-5' exonuclease and polymerase domains/uracil-DNA glycosylase